MALGKLKTSQKKLRPEEQFAAVNDLQLQMTLAAIADAFEENVRALIYKTYMDDEIHAIYRAIRNSNVYQKGGASKVHRKIIEFPNVWVMEFCDTVMTTMYGEDWLKNPAARNHELVKPWHVVAKI